MTPDPTLTDEELAEMREQIYEVIWSNNAHESTRCLARLSLDRLVAALRASREREKIAEESLTQLRDIVDAVEDDLGMDYINALIERS